MYRAWILVNGAWEEFDDSPFSGNRREILRKLEGAQGQRKYGCVKIRRA